MTICYSINTSEENAFNTLADFKKFSALHPYMTRVEETADSFLVEEVVPIFGFIKVPNRYSVQVTSSLSDRTVIYRSQVKRSVSLEIVWQIHSPDSIFETINIKSNRIIKFILGNIMKRVHKKVIDQL